METAGITALAVFIAVYILIAIHRTPWFGIKRPYAAIIGAAVVILIGSISVRSAFESIDFKVIFLLLGMMLTVAGLEYTGFFTLLSDFLVSRSASGPRLLLLIMVSSAVLSAIALNDAVVLMFTPIVIRCCVSTRIDPMPYLVGLMVSANIGSIATAVGNPQNAYITSFAGIDFAEYSLYSLPISVACLVSAYLVLLVFYRGRLHVFRDDIVHEGEDRPVNTLALRAMLCILAATFIGFIITGITDIELYQVALVSGLLSMVVIVSIRKEDAVWAVKRVDWGILVFFIGLFILVGSLNVTGVTGEISGALGLGEAPGILPLTVVSMILSNIVSNVPAVMLMTQIMPTANLSSWIALAASSTLAGNTTLLGSAANIIVAERSESYGVTIGFFRYMAIGLIVTAVTAAVMLLMVSIMFN